ncbi:MAG: hypothetical protein HC767_06100 [Akkermansiaceae bacterium]|nr:hypothetical protein [Akkermansiaceae bacterium]
MSRTVALENPFSAKTFAADRTIGDQPDIGIGERAARIDLLDLRGLVPLVRIGLRNALAFALAVSLLAAMSEDEITLLVTFLTMTIVAVVGVFALLLPVRGARRAIRAAKDAELLTVRAAEVCLPQQHCYCRHITLGWVVLIVRCFSYTYKLTIVPEDEKREGIA